MSEGQTISAAAAGRMTIGGDLAVNRISYGAMRITRTGIWDATMLEAAVTTIADSAKAYLRRAGHLSR
ncbi:MAG TPA: hypothetical protein VGK96_08570 [Candidatus Sulfotelmatobacter sp.]